ncbi:MAG: D-alanine--D-alanine ligase [Chitinophagaceae bacterium]
MKKKIALVTGGYSGESVISYQSAQTVEQNIDTELFDVYKIDITPDGWYYIPTEGVKLPVDESHFTVQKQGKTVKFDAALMCIHGTPGEDGKLQGYLDLMRVPYTSCDTTTSALTFNKRFTVAVAAFGGVHVAKSTVLFAGQPYDIAAIQKMQFPVFVKPNNGGSSIGMSKVDIGNPDAIKTALDKAFAVDSQVLVEEFIQGREFTIGVVRVKGKIVTLPMTEVLKPEGLHFFDFEAKYHGKNLEVTPAKTTKRIAHKVEETAKKVYQILNCKGIIRIDFIYDEALGEPLLLEVNTVPGQTSASLVPQQLAAMDWSLKDFYTALIEEAIGA